MKLSMHENEGCFALNITAENPVEMALLARFGTNVTQEIRYLTTVASNDGEFHTSMVLGKGKNHTTAIANWHRKDKK